MDHIPREAFEGAAKPDRLLRFSDQDEDRIDEVWGDPVPEGLDEMVRTLRFRDPPHEQEDPPPFQVAIQSWGTRCRREQVHIDSTADRTDLAGVPGRTHEASADIMDRGTEGHDYVGSSHL